MFFHRVNSQLLSIDDLDFINLAFSSLFLYKMWGFYFSPKFLTSAAAVAVVALNKLLAVRRPSVLHLLIVQGKYISTLFRSVCFGKITASWKFRFVRTRPFAVDKNMFRYYALLVLLPAFSICCCCCCWGRSYIVRRCFWNDNLSQLGAIVKSRIFKVNLT